MKQKSRTFEKSEKLEPKINISTFSNCCSSKLEMYLESSNHRIRCKTCCFFGWKLTGQSSLWLFEAHISVIDDVTFLFRGGVNSRILKWTEWSIASFFSDSRGIHSLWNWNLKNTVLLFGSSFGNNVLLCTCEEIERLRAVKLTNIAVKCSF